MWDENHIGDAASVVNRFVALTRLAKYRKVRWALRYARADRREFAV